MNPLPFILGLPREVKIAALIVAALVAFQAWRYFDRQDAVEADRAKSNAEATATARDADSAANRKTEAIRNEVEQGNDAARTAAGAGDDPLADGLRSLRAGKN